MSEAEEIAKAVQEGSKTANNLLNKIANVVGYVFEVRKHKKDAQKSIIDEIANRTDINPIERMAIISDYKKVIKHYKNTTNIIEKALVDLEPDAKVEDLKDDWIETFFEYAEKVSDEDIQLVWSKLLSSEANAPGTTPKSLLSTLYNLDNNLAQTFNELCGFCIPDECIAILPYKEEYKKIYDPLGLTYKSLTELQRHGLIVFNNLSEFGIQTNSIQTLYFANKGYCLKPIDGRVNFGNVMLTNDGMALCKCIAGPTNLKLIDIAESYWKFCIVEEQIQLEGRTYFRIKRKQNQD